MKAPTASPPASLMRDHNPRLEVQDMEPSTASRRLGWFAFLVLALIAIMASDAFAQSLSKKSSHQGRFDYTATFKLKNTASTAICTLEIQVASLNDQISAKIAPTGWNAAGPQNNAVVWEATYAGNCLSPGASKSDFGLVIDGVLPVDLHVCYADARGELVGLCQAIRVK